MKKLIFIMTFIVCGTINADAQNYDEYLSIARRHLAEGNIENARKAYSVYRTLSDSRDLSFEKQLGMKSSTPPPQDFVETTLGLNMKMVYVEGGDFLMGATSEQGLNAFHANEKPVRRVRLDSYYIGECEVTQAQWEKVMGTSIQQQRNKENKDYELKGVAPAFRCIM